MIERIYYRVKLNTDQIIYSQHIDVGALEAKLNENIIKDPSKTYLIWGYTQFPNSTNATFKAPAGCTIDWGDGTVETFETASTVVNTHTYTDGIEYHLISLSNYTAFSNAFFNCRGLTSVTIGNSITSIGSNAFSGCSGLTSVTIPNSVTSIAGSAFYGCSGLTSITIPDSVTSIGIVAFKGCSRLRTIRISAINPPTLYSDTFSETSIEKIIVPKSSIDAYKSADGWSTYADKIVYEVDSSDLVSLETKLNENIVKDPIKTYLVWKGDKFPNSTNATFKAPAGCTIDWGDGTVETFETASTEVNTHTYTDGFEYHLISLSNYTVVDSDSFSYCSGLTSVTIGNSVTSISDHVFFGCRSLSSVTIPNSVTSIGNDVFHGCIRLTSVTIPDSVTSIGYSAFWDCSRLTSITIPGSVTSMGYWAFSGCSGLKNIKISAINPPTLGSDAFETSLEKIIVPKSAINTYKSAAGWSTYADKIVYEVDSSDLSILTQEQVDLLF